MGVCQHILYNPVPAFPVSVDYPVVKTILLRVCDLMIEVALFFVAERFPITYKELEVSRIWLIHMRIVNLVHDPVAECEPEVAARMVRGPKPFLGAGGPSRIYAGCPEGNMVP